MKKRTINILSGIVIIIPVLLLQSIIFVLSASAVDLILKEPEYLRKFLKTIKIIDFNKYYVTPNPVEYDYGRAAEAELPGWSVFESRYGRNFRMQVDSRTNLPLLIEGKGIVWFPEKSKSSASDSKTKNAPSNFSISYISSVAMKFLEENRLLLNTPKEKILLDRKRSAAFGKSKRYQTLRYQYIYLDPTLGIIPVRGAYLFFRINHGNLTQFGNQLAVEPQNISTAGIISRQEAVARALEIMENPVNPEILDPAWDIGQPDRSIEIVPVNLPDGSLGHQLVRSVWIRTEALNYELWFDAHKGTLVYAINRSVTVDAVVRGGVYPRNNRNFEMVRGLPFLSVQNNGVEKHTDIAGTYDYDPPGSTAEAQIEGEYVHVRDECGESLLTVNEIPGDLNFGEDRGTDCSTPGFGGGGNTHAARTSFYHINQIKEKIRHYLNDTEITTPWLDERLEIRLNLFSVVGMTNLCNAAWDGRTLRFTHSSAMLPRPLRDYFYCSNPGENADLIYHEFGHALDEKTNGTPPERSSMDAFADTVAFLQTHSACIAENYTPYEPCPYGCDEFCDGGRDVDVSPNVRPENIAMAPADCARELECPYRRYRGVMGYEGHCESLIATGAVWDMTQGLIDRYGEMEGWALADRIWYESIYDLGSAYQIVSGGECNPDAIINGCGAENWYTVFLAVDDDNGDLADGTPNADIIWNAFNDHGIACGDSALPASSTCSPIDAVELSVTPDDGHVELSWDAVEGSSVYRIFRNDIGCHWGFTPVDDVPSSTVTYDDRAVANETPYYYAVQAYGTNDICVSPFSACVSATPREITISDATAPPRGTTLPDRPVGIKEIPERVYENLYLIDCVACPWCFEKPCDLRHNTGLDEFLIWDPLHEIVEPFSYTELGIKAEDGYIKAAAPLEGWIKRPMFVASLPLADSDNINTGALLFFDQSGKLIKTIHGRVRGERLGQDMDVLDDEIVVVSTRRLLRVRDGEVILESMIARDHYPHREVHVAFTADVDGDQRPEILLGTPYAIVEGLKEAGMVQVIGSDSGKTIDIRYGRITGDHLGRKLLPIHMNPSKLRK